MNGAIVYEIRATFSNNKSADIGMLQHPALIGDLLMGWTQRLQRTRFPLTINVKAFQIIEGERKPQMAEVEATFNRGMSRPAQIQLIDDLVSWARNCNVTYPMVASDEYWLYYRK